VIVCVDRSLRREKRLRRQHPQLAATRSPITNEEFLRRMEERGVSNETTECLLQRMLFAYRDGLRPDPDDRIFTDLHVLGEDASYIIAEYFQDIGRSLPDDESELTDTSLAVLGVCLDRHRQI